MQRTTLCFCFTSEMPRRVALARKLRGFGSGRVNAPGGKVNREFLYALIAKCGEVVSNVLFLCACSFCLQAEQGERADVAAVRETREEIGLSVPLAEIQVIFISRFELNFLLTQLSETKQHAVHWNFCLSATTGQTSTVSSSNGKGILALTI